MGLIMTNRFIRYLSASALFGLAATALLAQPKITGVTNAADYSLAVAPGSLATVFGTGMAASTGGASALPLPTALNNVSVTVGGKLAPLVYVSAGQINFQIPSATALGTVNLSVTNAGQVSNVLPFQVAATAPGLIQYGANHGVIQNQDYSLNAADNPAASGSTIILYLTGIGATSPAVADGTASPSSPLARPVVSATAAIGGAVASLAFIGLTPGNVGLAQANVQVPPLATGNYIMTIGMNGTVSKSAIVSVKGPGDGTIASVGLPDGEKCVSGQVNYVTFSLQQKVSGLADEASIGGTKLCATCELKPPIYGDFAARLESARIEGLNVDACYDTYGTMNFVRMRP
jgi:uncharacterized protein (TIGR03437 family)